MEKTLLQILNKFYVECVFTKNLMSSHLWCSGPVSLRKTDIEYSVEKKGRFSILDMKFIKQKIYFYVISIGCINSVSNNCGVFF